MASAGFLYALLNPSMPGLVKIGRTTRSPSERAAELSAPTGVATPFVVVYEAYFEDCDKAESYVHALLEVAGTRSANREFFRISSTEAVNAILRAKAATPGAEISGEQEPAHASVASYQREPWRSVFNEAFDYYLGTNGRLQDNDRAIEGFKMAARLGSLEAYVNLAGLHSGKEALEWLKRGADKGVAECWLELGYAFQGKWGYDGPIHLGNAYVALRNFLHLVDPMEFDPSGDRLYVIFRDWLTLKPPIEDAIGTRIRAAFLRKFRAAIDQLADAPDRLEKVKAIEVLTLQ